MTLALVGVSAEYLRKLAYRVRLLVRACHELTRHRCCTVAASAPEASHGPLPLTPGEITDADLLTEEQEKSEI